ncbi:nuclear transport factor 2 family protein [Aequorivita lipolytica]|uniref:histidine kinase n=1 Tax=Aequorivita lipolytica TaxID=153267 RepID=A0A5C6YQR7_9FLAO|nr:ATP-binding protein [Aequorivita lipolytica]TXD69851.1 hypothetical protein ESV24_05280 [Aequorivita lipolytica]SRX50332.1 Sensor protein FixL [Aequorivita lipolytica]
MKLTKKIETEVLKVYDTWLHSYLNGDVATYDSYLDEEYHFIGSTNNEEFLNRKATTKFFYDTAEQLAGKCDLRNETRTLEQFGELIFITHFFDAWFLNDTEYNYYGRFRFTSALQKNKEGWRFIYQHFSMPDSKTEEGETIGFEKINEENQQLRDAIQRRTIELESKNRELEIEGALQRIRAEAVAMKQSSDLLDIVVTMRTEFIKLGHEAHYFWHMMWLPEKYEKAMTSGDGTKIGFVMELPRHIHGDIPMLANWEKSDDAIIIYPMDTEAALAYVDKMVTLGDFQNIDPQAPSEDDIRHIGGLTFIMARTTHGEIGYSLPGVVKHPPKEDLEILEKFAGAFDLAHRRFLDLKKAEKQTREVAIELGLEKVRSRSLAMHSSDELRAASALLFIEITKLGIESITSGYVLLDEDEKIGWNYMPDPSTGKIMPIATGVFHDKTDNMKSIIKNWKKQEPVFVLDLDEKQTIAHQTFIAEESLNFPISAEKLIAVSPPQLKLHTFNFKQGYLLIVGGEKLSQEQIDVMLRFTKVFQQTYTRFLDLQKAEAQAREAQIEMALEKVRSRSMGMQNSEELKEVIQVVYNQFIQLNINIEHTGFIINYKERDDMYIWLADNHDVPTQVTLPYFDCAHFNSFNVAKQRGNDFFANQLSFEEKNKFYKNLFEFIPEASKEIKDYYFGRKALAISTVLLDNIGLYIENFDGIPYSEEENAILLRFGKVFQQTYTRFLDLKKAEAQTREAQINLAVERVRAKALAMYASEEIMEVVFKLKEEIMGLDIPNVAAATIHIKEKDGTYTMWDLTAMQATKRKLYQPMKVNYRLEEINPHLFIKRMWEHTDPYFLVVQDEEDFKRTLQFLRDHDRGKEASDSEELLKNAKIKKAYHPTIPLNNGRMCIDLLEPPSAEIETILTKMGAAFDLAYKRFEDLKKAEEQTKEAKIEASLEKVRNVALALKKSEDMLDIAQVLYEQLLALGFTDIRNAIIDIHNDDTETFLDYDYSHDMSSAVTEFSFYGDPVIEQQIKKVQSSNDAFFEIELKGAALEELIETRLRNGEKDDPRLRQIDHLTYNLYSFGNGAIGISNFGILSDDQKKILKRFRNVFTFAYKRYTDLANAEAQAREAQIEAALEKVRSRSLAMHKPDELQEVVALVAEKLTELGVIFDAGGVILCTYFPDNKDVVHWIVAPDFSHSGSYFVPYFDNPIFKDAWDSKIRGDAYFSKEFSVEAKNHFFEYAFEHSDYKHFPEDYKQHVLKADKHNLSAAWSKNSAIIIPSLTGVVPSENEAEIIKRFAKVFEQAYIRFMDLQKAEERARESQIDIALERVRSRTMGMQKSDELAETSAVLFKQIKEIATETWSCGFCIWQENDEVELWMGADSGGILPPMLIPYKEEPTHRDIYKASLNGAVEYNKIWKGKALKEHYAFLRTIPSVAKAIKVMEDSGLTLPDQQCYYVGFFKYGYLLLITKEPNDNLIELSKRFTNVFDLTYTRFLDLQLKEKQSVELLAEKQRLEVTLTDLQATQKQLIQSEKMASLGELTAGIAHEIQNPLNFVNNFSEVSNELLEEMEEEMASENYEEALEILNDIKQNLEKITHHGKRADGIVKGMLQHSRKSTAEKEPTDINQLADEYLRLAYHGLRAKDKSFNATLETDFDESIGMVNVIPQDMGRVILNLITNAFYAVNEKKSVVDKDLSGFKNLTGLDSYKPTVSVSTKKLKDSIEIIVKDNGNGIPKHVLDKIFQPFFTTKPTGLGTGLGLSLSYDIVKTHGGELKVESKERTGSEFSINLPTKNDV